MDTNRPTLDLDMPDTSSNQLTTPTPLMQQSGPQPPLVAAPAILPPPPPQLAPQLAQPLAPQLAQPPAPTPARPTKPWQRNPILNFLTGLFNSATWRGIAFTLVVAAGAFLAFWFLAVPAWLAYAGIILTFDTGGLGFIPGFLLLGFTIVLLALIVMGARSWGVAFRWLTAKLLKQPIEPPPRFERPRVKIRSWRDIWPATKAILRAGFSDGVGWRALLYVLASAATAAVSLLVSLFTLLPGLLAATYPIWWRLLPYQAVEQQIWQGADEFITQQIWVGPGALIISRDPVLPFVPGWSDNWRLFTSDWMIPLNTPGRIAIVALVGLLLLLIWAALMRAFGRLFRQLALALLGARPGDIREARLRAQREAVVNDADLRLRQIERDLHDGTQAQLVAVAMLLGEARELLAAGAPKPAAGLVETAHAQVKDALTDLREIASGIRPPALDAGLGVALQTLAARCPVPVGLTVGTDIDDGLDPAESAIAYYSISELLSNVVKHANARQASVEVLRNGAVLHIRVRDDGSGGATVDGAGGTGLSGIAERLAAIDGTMYVHSPAGGPTIVDLTIPTDGR